MERIFETLYTTGTSLLCVCYSFVNLSYLITTELSFQLTVDRLYVRIRFQLLLIVAFVETHRR